MLKINTTNKYAEFKSDTKSDLYPLNEISYTVENESETVSFYNRFYNKIMTEQISNIQVNDVPVTRDNIQDLLSVLFAANEGGGGGTVDLSNYYTKPEVDAKIDTKVDKVEGKQLSTEDYTTEEKTKLAGLENYDDTTVKDDIAANTAAIEAEVTRAKAAESTLNKKIPTVQISMLGNDKNFVYSEGKTGSTKNIISAIETGRTEFDNFIYLTYWGNSNSSKTIYLDRATTEKAGVMTADDKKNIIHYTGVYEITADEEGTLQMRNDVMMQYTTITGNTTIQLPNINYLYREFHLIFKGVTGSTITFPYSVVWKETPAEMVNGATYEFIFTYLNNGSKWYAGYIKYE